MQDQDPEVAQFISSVASWEQMRHVSLCFPPCSRIFTISLHFLLDGWRQVGEPWVSYWKARYDVVLRPPSVPISAPALVWVRSWLQGQTKRETAAGCQGNTGATHTHTGDVCRWLCAHTLRLVWWRRQRVTAGRLERRNLSRLQPMLKLAACHRLYLYNATSLVSRQVTYSHTDFWKWCISTTLQQNITPINRLHIWIIWARPLWGCLTVWPHCLNSTLHSE